MEQMKLPGNAEETHNDGSSDGGTLKEHVGDRTESLSLKKIVLDGTSSGDKLLDVTCQKEVLDKRSFGAKCGKRALECGDEILSIKCQKLQACDVGLKSFNSRCQMKVHSEERQAQEGEEVINVCEGPNLKSTKCDKQVDCSDANFAETQNTVFSEKIGMDQEICRDGNSEEDMDRSNDRPKPIITEFQNKSFSSGDVAGVQSRLHSGNIGRDQLDESSVLKEKSRDDCAVAGADLKICCKTEGLEEVEGVSNEQIVSLHNKSPEIGVDFELVYERDKKRMQEALSDENTESKKLRVQDVIVDLTDEAALEHLPSPQLYERLRAVDPDMAQYLHPNDKRKIIR